MVNRDVRQWGVRKLAELYRRAVEIGWLVAEWDRVVGIRRITWKKINELVYFTILRETYRRHRKRRSIVSCLRGGIPS